MFFDWIGVQNSTILQVFLLFFVFLGGWFSHWCAEKLESKTSSFPELFGVA
jgi:hypothetical protein